MSSLQSHLFDEDDDDDDDDGGQESIGSRDDHVTDSPGGGFFDHPPESFCVSREDSEQGWFYRNAATVQRKASKKLTFSGGGGPGHRRKSSLIASSSNRKRNLSLIALPAAQKSRPAAGDRIFRRDNGGLFRSWSDPGGKSAVPVPEPGSPVVTCTGRVRTRKEGGGKTGLVKWFGTVLRNGFGKNRVSSKASTG